MDTDATQVIDDINLDVTEERRRDGSPVSFLKLLKQKNFEEKLIPIFEGVNKVGRDVACHVMLESKTLSKEHCCIEVICDNHFIYDLGSSNKSRRNKMVLMPNVRYELNNNDALTLADVKLVYVKRQALHVDDSGSDTESLPESESMLQVSCDGVGVAFQPLDASATDDDEDDDPSSDILLPTQHAGAHLIGLHNKMDAFVEDSFLLVTSKNKEKESFADETVLETPPRALFGAELGSDFVPESDSETEAEAVHCIKPKTSKCDITKAQVKSRAVASDEPTQTYSMDLVNETIAVVSQSKSASVPEESPALSDADIAPTQVFVDASAQKFDVDEAAAEVFAQFPVEKLSSSASLVQSRTDSSMWKATEQESSACSTDVEETQVVQETALPIALGDWKAKEKLGVNEAMQMYVEETQMYEDEASAVIKVPSLIDKPQSLQKDKGIVRESGGGSVINFSPQSASTQVFCSDGETSFLPTLVLETSDRLDADDDLVPPPPPPPLLTAAIALSSESLVRCTGLNSNMSQLSTDDVCTQVFGGNEVRQMSVEQTEDNLCTQIYEDMDWHLGGPGEAVVKSSASTDDICTQVYQDRDGHISSPGEAAAESSACTDDTCSRERSTDRTPHIMLEGLVPVSSNLDLCAPNPATPDLLQESPSTITSHANKVALKEITKQGASRELGLLQMQLHPAELITVERSGVSHLVSESAVGVTAGKMVEDRDSDSTDELATKTFDIPGMEKRIKGKRYMEAAEPNDDKCLREGKKVGAEDSLDLEVSGSWSATKKTIDQKQRRNSKLSNRRSIMIQDKAEAINLDEEAQGHSSNESDQPCNESPEKKTDEKSRQDYGSVTKQSRRKQIDADKIINSEVSDNSRKRDEICSEKGEVESSSKALGRRASMRQNKGKRPEDNDFLKPSEEKKKTRGGSKRQAEALQPSGVESPNKKQFSGPEETPIIYKSASEGLDSQSSRGTKGSEVVDSSQLSDDDLPSLASLVALNRGQGIANRNALSKGHGPRFSKIVEVENVQPVGELESDDSKDGAIGGRIDIAEGEIMKKESGNKNKTRRGSERKERTEAKMLSEDDRPMEENDPTTYEAGRNETRNKTQKKKMSLGSKKSQTTKKKDLPEDDVLMEEKGLEKPEMAEFGNMKKIRAGSKNQKIIETTKIHSEECYVSVSEKPTGDRSCESASEKNQGEGAVDVEAGLKKSRRVAGHKQMFRDSVAEARTEVNEKSGGHQRRKNAENMVTEKSVVRDHEGSFSAELEVPVRSEEPSSSKNTYSSSALAILTESDSECSEKLETESSVPCDRSSGRGRRRVRPAVRSNDDKAAGSIRRKGCRVLAANVDANDEDLKDNDAAIELMTLEQKSCGITLAADLSVVKETIEEVPKRSSLRKKSLGPLVGVSEDGLTSKETNADVQKAKSSQPLKESETDSAELGCVGETKRTAKTRQRVIDSELSALNLKKKGRNAAAAAAAADGEEAEGRKMGDSEIKLLTFAKKDPRAIATDLDHVVMIESSKELEKTTVDGAKTNRVCAAGEVVDSHDAERSIDVRKSVMRKSCRGLFTDNDDKAMKKLSSSESSSLDEISSKILETEDAADDRPKAGLCTKKTDCRILSAERNVDVVQRAVIAAAAKPVRAETGSRRGKKTEHCIEEERPDERLTAVQETTSGKKNYRALATSAGVVVSSGKPMVQVLPTSVVVEEVSEQRLKVTSRKRKNSTTTLNENDRKDAAEVKIDSGVDSKRLRLSGKALKTDSKDNEASSDLKPDKQMTTQDLAKGSRRRTKSGLEPVIKPKVMFTGVVDENGQKTVKSLGGEMVESVYDCTHLVTDQVRRTVKFLCGVARGLSIVSPKWLEDSRSAGRFLDPSGFLVSDVENEKKFNFNLEWTLKEAAKQPLLMGMSIHVTGHVRPDPSQMKDIINCAGGKFVQELPRSSEDNLIIVTSDGKDLESCRRLEELGIPLVSSEYIMTGILQHKLDANLFRLTTKKTPETSKRNKSETFPGSRKKQKK